MCIVIDINTFPSLFKTDCADKPEFEPVIEWINREPSAKIIYGGTKYKKELLKMGKYLGVIVELKKRGKVTQVNDELVDRSESQLIASVNDPDFDDPHILAIFIVSGCRIFCSKDKRADRFIKDKSLYPKGHSRPSIYRSKRNIRLLNNKMLVSIRNSV